MPSTYLSRTGIGSSNNQKKWTFSGWFKKASNGSELRLITSSDNSSYDDNIRFDSTDKLRVKFNNATVLLTNRLFRDNNAYYHIVVKVDTDQSTANDRIVLYINGVDERTVGGYSTSSMPNQGTTGYINYTQHYIGVTNPTANSNHFNGIMSHVHFTDGYAYTPTSFGETDTTTGEWKIKVDPSVSYGTTGFWILKDGNSVTDSSPNSNTFTVSAGTLTKTEDNPSNVFATINPLDNYYANATFSLGNTRIVTGSGREASNTATIPMFKGKYYWETKMISANAPFVGIQPIPSFGNTASPAVLQLNGYGLLITGKVETTNGSGGSTVLATYTTYTTGDIIGTAVDLDSAQNKIYFYKNGTILGASGVNITSVGSTSQGMYLAAFGVIAGQDTIEVNFGNGYFGTTAVSSAGTNASGNGIFEYDVPTGYTALSTKGLNL